MKKSIGKLAAIILLAIVFACPALAAESDPNRPDRPVLKRPVIATDFRVDVATNGNRYLNRDILCLTVRLLNDSRYPAFVGVCPVEPAPADPNVGEIEEIDQGFLDGLDVDVAIMSRRPIVIGYATLTRLGPSPVPTPVPGAEEAATAEPKPKKFRLPLFGSPRVPGHSTRIISVANILILCPPIEPEPDPGTFIAETESGDVTDPEPIDIIPAIGRYVAPRPGYYLLDCRIEKICGTKLAQAQKIIRIRPRIPKAVPEPKPKPEPVPGPAR